MLRFLTVEKVEQICERCAGAKGEHDDYKFVLGIISELNIDELSELMALMWLGQSNINEESYLEHLEHAYRTVNLENSPHYIAGKQHLDKILRNGLEKIHG